MDPSETAARPARRVAPDLRELPRDLPDLLGRLARRDPTADVVVDRSADGTRIAVSRGTLWRRTRALAARLAGAGVGPGDCVAVWLPNWSDALVWQFAVAARGAHVVGVNTRYNVTEVAHVLDRARPRLVALAHGFHDLDLIGRLRVAVDRTDLEPPVVAAVAGPGGTPPRAARVDVGGGAWEAVSEPGPDGPEPPPLYAAHPRALAAAFTTSGSTGLPKLAAHRGIGILTHAVADAVAIGIAEGDRMLCALPLSGVFGFNAALAAIAAGGVCVLEPVFDADTVLDDMVTYGVRHVGAGDDLVLRLAQAWRDRPRDLSRWRWWGAADFQGRSAELARWADEEFGTVAAGVYGSSEVFALTAMWPADEPLPRRVSGGGRVVHPGIEVRVADPETSAVLAAGQEGELQFRGPNVVDAYLGDDTAAARSFTVDGWFRSGDLGTLVEQGAFTYICRMGDVLRLRGFLVDPAEIELRLAAHPRVHTAKVVGVPDPDGGTVAVGFVTPDGPDPDPAKLREWCAAELAAFKVPRTVHVISRMPTTTGTNGTKIKAATLREWAVDGVPG
jgi:acyl-CoA synthetase (AMP-forming)/AMP-acid ligase II